MSIARSQEDMLDWAAHNARFGWLFTTGRTHRRATVQRMIALGLVRSVGEVVMVDGDGYTKQPERYREGFELTEAGKATHNALRAVAAAIGGQK